MSIYCNSQFHVQLIPDPNDPSKNQLKIQHGPNGLFAGGIILDLAVGIDAISQASTAENLQDPKIVKALVDTGCTITSIDSSLITALNLQTRGFQRTITANGSILTSLHFVSIDFPGSGLRGKPTHQVQAVNLSEQSFQVLIGRDLMTSWSITYNGPAGFVSISD